MTCRPSRVSIQQQLLSNRRVLSKSAISSIAMVVSVSPSVCVCVCAVRITFMPDRSHPWENKKCKKILLIFDDITKIAQNDWPTFSRSNILNVTISKTVRAIDIIMPSKDTTTKAVLRDHNISNSNFWNINISEILRIAQKFIWRFLWL